jgi:hypothetical protein
MHKEKNLEMSHEGFFLLGTHQKKKNWEFFLDINFSEYFKCQPI